MSRVNFTAFASAVVGTYDRRGVGLVAPDCTFDLPGEVLIPRLHEFVLVLLDEPTGVIQLASIEPIIGRQVYGKQPELGFMFTGLDMNVRGLFAFVAEEKEAKATNPQHDGHVALNARIYRIARFTRADARSPAAERRVFFRYHSLLIRSSRRCF
jgi:hypothetical protein